MEMFLFNFYSNLFVRAAQGPFIRMYPQQVSVTSRPKRERQFFLSPIPLCQAGSRGAAATGAMPRANRNARAEDVSQCIDSVAAAPVARPGRHATLRGLRA
jgi:hypothetical protein